MEGARVAFYLVILDVDTGKEIAGTRSGRHACSGTLARELAPLLVALAMSRPYADYANTRKLTADHREAIGGTTDVGAATSQKLVSC